MCHQQIMSNFAFQNTSTSITYPFVDAGGRFTRLRCTNLRTLSVSNSATLYLVLYTTPPLLFFWEDEDLPDINTESKIFAHTHTAKNDEVTCLIRQDDDPTRAHISLAAKKQKKHPNHCLSQLSLLSVPPLAPSPSLNAINLISN